VVIKALTGEKTFTTHWDQVRPTPDINLPVRFVPAGISIRSPEDLP
jgi:hypothetical protein